MQTNTGTPPPKWRHAAIAKERPPRPASPRRMAQPAEIAAGFVAWMREQDYCHWMVPRDLRLALEDYCDIVLLELPRENVINPALAKVHGVEVTRKRLPALNSRAALRALGLRTEVDRCDLYRILDVDEIAACPKPVLKRRGKPAAAPEPLRAAA